MDYHQNARLTVHSREQLAKMVMERDGTLKAAAAAFNVSGSTVAELTFSPTAVQNEMRAL